MLPQQLQTALKRRVRPNVRTKPQVAFFSHDTLLSMCDREDDALGAIAFAKWLANRRVILDMTGPEAGERLN